MANETSDRASEPVRDENAMGVKTENCRVDQCEKRLLFDEIEHLREQNYILRKLVAEYKVRNREVLRQENDDVFSGFRGNNEA
jgi:FtsZ-binding cell division protein ZapB